MNNDSSSCTVAPLTKCNHATVIHDSATQHETTKQPLGLLGLAIKVLERNQINTTRNSAAILQLHHTETYATKKFADIELHRGATNKSRATTGQSQESCTVAFCKGSNCATELACTQCGYCKSLCECMAKNTIVVTCNGCEHFTHDKIGDGAGIGDCGLSIKWTYEGNTGRIPLYRYAPRHCNQYSKLMS